MRVASTKPDLNISKVVFRLDIADTLLLKLHVCGNKKGLTRGINYRVHVDLCIRYVKNLNCSIAAAFAIEISVTKFDMKRPTAIKFAIYYFIFICYTE